MRPTERGLLPLLMPRFLPGTAASQCHASLRCFWSGTVRCHNDGGSGNTQNLRLLWQTNVLLDMGKDKAHLHPVNLVVSLQKGDQPSSLLVLWAVTQVAPACLGLRLIPRTVCLIPEARGICVWRDGWLRGLSETSTMVKGLSPPINFLNRKSCRRRGKWLSSYELLSK